jgi:N-methylhydantoinase B
MIENDVLEGYISVEKAKEDYGVVIDPMTMKVDREATQRLRSQKV